MKSYNLVYTVFELTRERLVTFLQLNFMSESYIFPIHWASYAQTKANHSLDRTFQFIFHCF